ncbi:MAG: hypothetical protein LBP59_07610, partial [Planctomycetaceae bacterium]|nr:hypothetical protein [Planctomycetaceae bacterium]
MTTKSSNKKAAKKVVKREVKKSGKKVTTRKGNIKWHTGFVGAMMADLRDVGCEVKVTQEKHFVISEH